MRIVRELEIHRPAFFEAILDLDEDIVVGEIGQEGKAPWVMRIGWNF